MVKITKSIAKVKVTTSLQSKKVRKAEKAENKTSGEQLKTATKIKTTKSDEKEDKAVAFAKTKNRKSAAAVKDEISVENIIGELEEARQLALASKSPSAAITATMGKAKLLGLATNIKADDNEADTPPKEVMVKFV